MKFTTESGADAARLRKRLELNQEDFWNGVHVTQSGGSRYEGGREMPEPVAVLLTIRYGDRKEAERAVRRLNPALMNGHGDGGL